PLSCWFSLNLQPTAVSMPLHDRRRERDRSRSYRRATPRGSSVDRGRDRARGLSRERSRSRSRSASRRLRTPIRTPPARARVSRRSNSRPRQPSSYTREARADTRPYHEIDHGGDDDDDEEDDDDDSRDASEWTLGHAPHGTPFHVNRHGDTRRVDQEEKDDMKFDDEPTKWIKSSLPGDDRSLWVNRETGAISFVNPSPLALAPKAPPPQPPSKMSAIQARYLKLEEEMRHLALQLVNGSAGTSRPKPLPPTSRRSGRHQVAEENDLKDGYGNLTLDCKTGTRSGQSRAAESVDPSKALLRESEVNLVVFATPAMSEQAVIEKLEAMGIKYLDPLPGVLVERFPPFVELTGSSAFMPIYKVVYSLTPMKTLNVEYNASDKGKPGSKQVALRGTQGMVRANINLFVQFFGRVADVAAQRPSYGVNRASGGGKGGGKSGKAKLGTTIAESLHRTCSGK
ncbi:unnamed protein product, partial [Polarella glacialis]